jgi:vacuolar iron transporter family protein
MRDLAMEHEHLKPMIAKRLSATQCGAVPLMSFLVESPATFQVSTVMTAMVFFLIGSTKSRWALVSWWRSGAETMAIGLGAAALAFLIGHGRKTLV